MNYREEFFSETEHILIRCGESSRRRAGSRRIGAEGSRPFAMPRRSRLATCRLLVKPLEPLILICAPCGGVHLNHPKIIRVVTYRTCLLGNWVSGVGSSRKLRYAKIYKSGPKYKRLGGEGYDEAYSLLV